MIFAMLIGCGLVAFIVLVLIPFIQGVKEGIGRYKTKKELIKKFEE
jgi:hypothetical protein